MQLLHPGGQYLTREHFRPLLMYIIDAHPSLDFLKAAPDFHARYVDTVLARIFYTVNRYEES
jgi:serine/threonine-protein phosphatase 2A regulatory subunit B''